MGPDEFGELSDRALDALEAAAGEDWSRSAAGLEWSCWQTVDHIIDCVFSYAFQIAAGASSGFLPFNELHAQPTATPDDLVLGLRGMVTALRAILDAAPHDATASDGVLALGLSDWRARAAFELSLHTYDVVTAFGVDFRLSDQRSRSLIECPTLWMLDRDRACSAEDPWTGLLAGSGRAVT
jgi:hypothetical protein